MWRRSGWAQEILKGLGNGLGMWGESGLTLGFLTSHLVEQGKAAVSTVAMST